MFFVPDADSERPLHPRPFCTSVCPYCDFAVTIAGEERRRAWVDGIVREAQMYADIGLAFDTVYLGGGTPSSLTNSSSAFSVVSDDISKWMASRRSSSRRIPRM